jgi:hypothetical protein
VVERELGIIRRDLHCNAVRITGGSLERLKVAARAAAAAGLEVWISPFTNDLTADQLLELLAGCADHAERLRRQGAEVVLLTGSELSVCIKGIVPGETFEERVGLLTPSNPRIGQLLAAIPAQVNDLLARAVRVVRERFGGKVSYASLPFENVDWTPFDFVATDAGYRSAESADRYPEMVRALVAQGKPVAITEFGCCTYKGAADRAAHGPDIVEWDAATVTPLRLDGDHVRDEQEQATYLRELLDVFEAEGVDSAFVYTFARYDLPHRGDPRLDLDMASAGVVKVLEDGRGRTYPDMAWEPKAAFAALAERYRG